MEFIFPTEQSETAEMPEKTEVLENGVIREIIGKTETTDEVFLENETVFGDPEDAENWHIQSESNSCAVACQEFVAEQLLDRDFSEQKMIDYAEKQGWYEGSTGTTKSDVGKLLESLGLEVERMDHCTIEQLAQSLDEGEKVICGVNNMILEDPRFADVPGITANHAVQVIGVDYSDRNRPQVILNDPGVKNGKGIRYDLETFEKAWRTSDHFAVFAGKGEMNE